MTVIWETACHSDIGGRDEQQDRVETLARYDAWLLVLAEGMGGDEGGASAAQSVIDVATASLPSAADREPKELLIAIAEGAHDRINVLGVERQRHPAPEINATEWSSIPNYNLTQHDHSLRESSAHLANLVPQ